MRLSIISILYVLISLSVVTTLSSCKSKLPKGVMEKEKMENLLYDYHLAQSMASLSSDSANYYTRLYCNAVYRKYGVTEEEFNHSMEWYARHSEELFDIYKNLDKRFVEMASATGSDGGSQLAVATGDTANIWQGRHFYLLTSTGNNRMTFKQKADSTLHVGDKLIWKFNASWMYREGMKSAMALLAVKYDNDSVTSVSHYLYGSGTQELTLQLGDRQVKSVSGFVYQNAEWSERPKLLIISTPELIRYHRDDVKEVEMQKPQQSDTLRNDSLSRKDSLLRISVPRSSDMSPRPSHRVRGFRMAAPHGNNKE